MKSRATANPALVLTLLVLASLAALTARADLFVTPTATTTAVTSINVLTAACSSVAPNSTAVALVTSALIDQVKSGVVAEAGVSQLYVGAYFDTTSETWLWQAVEGGTVETLPVDAARFVGGAFPSGTAPFAIYDFTANGLVAVSGTAPYRVLCTAEKFYTVDNSAKFPWWAILIIVLGSVAIIAVVIVVVCCCCCKKKKNHVEDDEDTTTFATRNASFHSGTHNAFAARNASRGDGSRHGKREAASSSTGGSGDYSDVSSVASSHSDASSAGGSSRGSGATSASPSGSSSHSAFTDGHSSRSSSVGGTRN